ncbi:hypothetical protein cyc_06140 [Cyclospora cayetanensis]|uniref:Mitochondrial inner membrane protease ATP23 n=1 Tax=Cyclospora cayetanensis TaxID=88456 RepID=A0A1D3CR00_9EIME|nr:hypothetical protein cyc_06140 [Cyclospora cayetanensis]
MGDPASPAPSKEGSWAFTSLSWSRMYSWWNGYVHSDRNTDICGCTLWTFPSLTSRISVEHGLSKLFRWQAELLSLFALQNWRVKVVTHALSAMQRPPSLVIVQCGYQQPSPAGAQEAKELGGYSPEHNVIWICGNRLWSPFNFRRVLLHELLHAFDFARAKIDTDDCSHIACTEIRAINLSEQCGLWASRNLTPAVLDQPLDKHLLLKYSAWKSHSLHQQAAAAKMLSDEAAVAAVDAARIAAASVGSESAVGIAAESNAAVAALNKAEQLAARTAAFAKAAQAADETAATVASPDVPLWERSKRNACVARQAWLSVQQQPQCRHHGTAEAAVASVFSRCLADTWPFEHPPEFDSRFRPSRIYEEHSEALFGL